MCNWFKKLFGCKCHCDHCASCGDKSADKKPNEAVKTEAGRGENVNKA